MGNYHHHVCAVGAHLGHVLTRGFGDVVHRHFAAQIGFIPGHDLRWHKADIANLQRLLVTVFIDHLSFFNQIRRKQRLFGLNVDDIGINVREFSACQRFMQVIQTIVEFVIAEVTDAVIEQVHGLINRVNIALFQPFGRHVIAHRAALDNVTVIDQYAVFYFITSSVNQARGAHQPEFFGGGIFVVIKIHHIAVQISGFHNAEIHRCGIYAGSNQRRQKRCAKLDHQRHPFFRSETQN